MSVFHKSVAFCVSRITAVVPGAGIATKKRAVNPTRAEAEQLQLFSRRALRVCSETSGTAGKKGAILI